ncbi:MAG: MFS transporter, partial [Pyrinomonadaceae bacterium]|nr:MFS transporter [Pyrinomonadaceae bacterium]
LALTTGELGAALLGMALGALVAMPTTGWLTARFGSRLVTRVSALGFCVAVILPALASGRLWLVSALVVLGVTHGAMDVAMNAQAAELERAYRRPIMSSFHALFSFGGMAGAGVGGVMAHFGVEPLTHLSSVALSAGSAALVASRRLLANERRIINKEPVFARPERSLLGLGVITFCVMFGEGAMADWTAIYLLQTLQTDAGVAAAGYAAFSLAMAVGRLTGDRLTAGLGQVTMLRVGGSLAALGMGVSLIANQAFLVIVGFALVGAGFSTIVPLVFSAAGRNRGMSPGAAIAAVSTVGYFGFLVGPPLIGFGADRLTLRGALGVVVILSGMIAILSGTIRRF